LNIYDNPVKGVQTCDDTEKVTGIGSRPQESTLTVPRTKDVSSDVGE